MSNFDCPICGVLCLDTEFGYVTGCQHYAPDANREALHARVMVLEQQLRIYKKAAETDHILLAEARERLRNWPAAGGE